MPDARTHDLITLISAVGANVAYFSLKPNPDPALAVLFTSTYLFAGYACAGDLDLDSTEYRRWGPLRFLWWPYKVLVPHRSWISHGLIMGGLIRVIYLALVTTGLLWLVLWLYSRLGPHVNAGEVTRAEWSSIYMFAQMRPLQAGALLAGFILAGSAHSISDAIYSRLKRRRRRR